MKKISYLYPLFAITIFLGSFLLFQVQPIIGKYILPWFGGTSFVWIASLLFFQTLLLAGYFYAYLLAKLSIKSQALLHGLLIVVTFGVLLFFFHFRTSPIIPGLQEKLPDTFAPIIQVLCILVISVGLPYFLLSTTSTLLQKWFSFSEHKKSPYSLYAISNVGSLLGLMSYPFVVEPTFSLQQQGFFWSISFLSVCLLLFFCSGYALMLHKKNSQTAEIKQAPHTSSSNKRQILLWFSLPAISSLLLLAATNQLTQAIAPIPFLWLLPLCLYLLSFILCFSKKSLYQRTLNVFIFLITMFVVLALLLQSIIVSVFWQLIIYALLLFSGFMLCHGELYAQRPSVRQLNMFYLLIALGSVLGAFVVAVIAPILFVGLYWELYLALYATALVAVFTLVASRTTRLSQTLYRIFLTKSTVSLFLCFIVSGFFIFIAFISYTAQSTASVGIWRNFYGTQRVTHQKTAQGTLACLLNGKIIHGCQYLQKNLKTQPLTYFGPDSGVMLAIQSLHEKEKHLKIGIIGLGVGTIAAYGQKGDDITFYELNPQDITIARTQFSYLSDSKAQISVIPGDGRLSLAKEMQQKGPMQDNLFVIDAFNDDAIPVHLLTKEAFALYRQNVIPHNSIIAVHISTTYVDLTPVVLQLARHYGMSLAVITTPSKGPGLTTSRWALLTSDPALLETAYISQHKQNPATIKQVQLWTDDYSNVVQLLRY